MPLTCPRGIRGICRPRGICPRGIDAIDLSPWHPTAAT